MTNSSDRADNTGKTLMDLAREEYRRNAGLSVDHFIKVMDKRLYHEGPIALSDEFKAMQLTELRRMAFEAFETRFMTEANVAQA